MRLRSLLRIPLLLSVGTISWALLIAGLILLSAVVIAPAVHDVKDAERTRNDYHATLQLLDQQIALEKDFNQAATTDPILQARLAGRQLNLTPKDQVMLVLDPNARHADRSVKSLLAESLTPVQPKQPTPINPLLAMAGYAPLRPMLIILACAAISLSVLLGVKYPRN